MTMRDAWVWPPGGMAAMSAYWDAAPDRQAPQPPPPPPGAGAAGQSPSRYLYRGSGAGAAGDMAGMPPMFVAQQPGAGSGAPMAPPFFAPTPQAAGAPVAGMPFAPPTPEMAQQLQRLAARGMPMIPFGYGMMDPSQLPLLMHMAQQPAYALGGEGAERHMAPAGAAPDALENAPWAPDAKENVPPSAQPHPDMDSLLALSRQAQVEAGGDPHVFVCPHCDKRYAGKHARSIWRRHLQDKHAIPLSVQPRRTRWDRDTNRPRNAEERRERMLESKRRWARKKREQERNAAAGGQRAASAAAASASPETESAEPARTVEKPAPPPAYPTPRRAFGERDANVRGAPQAAPEPLKSSSPPPPRGAAPTFAPGPPPPPPLPAFQATPLRDAWRGLMGSPASPVGVMRSWDMRRAPPPSAGAAKRSSSDRAALAALSRAEPSPRGAALPGSASKRARTATEGAPASPTAPAPRSARQSDQFSSPQHLNLTQSLGLAPQSTGKSNSMYPPSMGLTPMAGGTPFSKFTVGLTPTLGGLLRGGTDGPPSANTSGLLGPAGDLSGSGYVFGGGFGGLDTPSMAAPPPRSARRSARASGGGDGSMSHSHGSGAAGSAGSAALLHSSSERDEEDDEDLDQENVYATTGSPTAHPRPKLLGKKALLADQDTPSKMRPPLRSPVPPLRQRTPQSRIR